MVERVAQNGKSHNVAAARADALNKSSDQKQRTADRIGAQCGGQREDYRSADNDRLASGFVGDAPGDQHCRRHAGQIDGKRDMQLSFARGEIRRNARQADEIHFDPGGIKRDKSEAAKQKTGHSHLTGKCGENTGLY